MPQEYLTRPQEISRDPVVINEANAIRLEEALTIANAELVPLGKSTLQRWALKWFELGSESPVKCTEFIATGRRTYFVDREDFKVWLLERKQNLRPHEILQDPEGSHEVSQDFGRPRETSKGPTRPQRSEAKEEEDEEIKELQKENIHLKIDIAVRNQLLDRAMEEIKQVRMQSEMLLRENGALDFQLKQLPPGTRKKMYDNGEQETEPADQGDAETRGETGEVSQGGETNPPLT